MNRDPTETGPTLNECLAVIILFFIALVVIGNAIELFCRVVMG